jgi:quinoprotein dehydrogenase-associated probable ABC transporter substrate-binding protein
MLRERLVGMLALACLIAHPSGCARGPARDEQAVPPPSPPGQPRLLRVCADPNNLPFSNDRGEGFENILAGLIAADLGRTVEYTWWAQRRGFIRNTLNADVCDVVMGLPAGSDMVSTTVPYYTSTYVLVGRPGNISPVTALDDPRLKRLTIGVHLAGDDYGNPPPAHALARRGIIDNVRGFRLTDDYSRPSPTARIIEAVATRDIDVAIVWGPIGGYFAARQPLPLSVHPVAADENLPGMPFRFSIAVAVRRGDDALRDEIEGVLVRRRAEIDALLARFHVPTVTAGVPTS